MSTNATKSASIPWYRSTGLAEHAVLFIHGFMDAAIVWKPVIRALQGDQQKITIDLPGMGAFNSYSGELSLAIYAGTVGHLIQHIGKPVVIVGQSMGAQIAELAAVANARLVRGLVLVAPIPLRGMQAPAEATRAFKQLGGQPELQRQERRKLSHALTAENEALLGAAGDLVRPSVVSALVDLWNLGAPAGDEPSTFTAPVLVIGGASDKLVPRETIAAIAARFADGRETTIDCAGHWPHVEQPSQVAGLIDDYLKNVDWSPTERPSVAVQASYSHK